MGRRPAKSADDLLTSTQAAEIAGLNRSHFARLVSQGKGPKHQRLDTPKRHIVVIRRGDLAEWISGRGQ